jgi:branched-chain amino acid transport system substrate-binding protein
MKQCWIGAAAMVGALTMVAACSSTETPGDGDADSDSRSPTSEPLVIPFIGEITGAISVIGSASLEGAKTAVHEINEAGGIDGRQVELKVYDGASDATKEAAALREIFSLNPKPPVLLLSVGSAYFLPSKAAVKQANIPMMGAAGPVPGLEDVILFSPYPDFDGVVGGLLGVYQDVSVETSLEGKKFAYSGLADSPVADAKLEVLQEVLEAQGAEVVEVFRDPFTLSSWGTQAAKLVDSGADALLMDMPSTTATVIAKAAVVAGFDAPVIASSAGSNDAFLEAVSADNVYGVRDAMAVQPGNDLFKAVEAAGANTTNAQLTNTFAYTYGGTWAAAQALNECGLPCSPEDYVAAIEGLGEVQMGTQAFYGPVDFSGGGVSGVDFAVGFGWDKEKGEAVAVTDVLDLSAD